ncbi:MAG: electron transport complex subunit RsxC, partial [Psychromonas sp.]|nr:electron transport complex subunit RsxC [Psychromonas sp.]
MTQQNNLLSDELLEKIASGKLWNFHGGLHPTQNKIQSSQYPISDADIAPYLTFAIEQKGEVAQCLVNIGDTVLKGQALTKASDEMVVQHASSSGHVVAIEPRSDLHPSGVPVLSVVIKTDGVDRSINYKNCKDYIERSAAFLISEIQNYGIIGLGGAGFPTHTKLRQAKHVRLLIINGVECEPYITSDDRLMQEHAQEIIQGIGIAEHVLNPKLTVIAIEDNKQQAINALQRAAKKLSRRDIIIRCIPTIYPSGSAKQLIQILTGEQTPLGKHANELGIVMLNTGTVFSLKEAILDGKPLISRIVTLTGNAFKKKGNLNVRLGTPIQYLLDKYGLNIQDDQRLIIGGPMMGFTLSHADIPVTKICNCILAPTTVEMPIKPPEMACIRCSDCALACPANLLPQQLLWYSQSKDHDKLDEYNLSACIECGICSYVCPSSIPLVEYYRIAKSDIWMTKQETRKIEIARQRYENRENRLAQAKINRQAKHKEAAVKRRQQLKDKNTGEDITSTALQRTTTNKAQNPQNDIINQASTISTTNDPRKNAIAAAVARAKAKKAQKTKNDAMQEVPPMNNENIIEAREKRKQKARLHKIEKQSQENNQLNQSITDN